MNFEEALGLARSGKLYPGLILHGADRELRLTAAIELARTLLCEREPGQRPCDQCRHCRRIVGPAAEATAFHPDFLLLERDLRTVTSADAVRNLVRAAQLHPFEARGQVFVLADAETLADAAANALLKNLEEPPTSAPRHYLLLAPSAVELLPTLRSRSLPIYLGLQALEASGDIESLIATLRGLCEEHSDSGSPVLLLAVAGVLHSAGNWDDPRSLRPWSQAAGLILELVRESEDRALRQRLLQLSEELLVGPELRVRGVPALRILEGAVAHSLARPIHQGS